LHFSFATSIKKILDFPRIKILVRGSRAAEGIEIQKRSFGTREAMEDSLEQQ
jgi:hypothetical protein